MKAQHSSLHFAFIKLLATLAILLAVSICPTWGSGGHEDHSGHGHAHHGSQTGPDTSASLAKSGMDVMVQLSKGLNQANWVDVNTTLVKVAALHARLKAIAYDKPEDALPLLKKLETSTEDLRTATRSQDIAAARKATALLRETYSKLGKVPGKAPQVTTNDGSSLGMCSIMPGNPAKKDIFADHNGKRYYFCCEGCKATFLEDPAKYAAQADEASKAAAANALCPVSGEPVDKAVFTDHEGKRYYFCCTKCQKKFAENPSQYITGSETPQPEGHTGHSNHSSH